MPLYVDASILLVPRKSRQFIQCTDHRIQHEGLDSSQSNHERLELAYLLHKLGHTAEATRLVNQLEASISAPCQSGASNQCLLEQSSHLRNLLKQLDA